MPLKVAKPSFIDFQRALGYWLDKKYYYGANTKLIDLCDNANYTSVAGTQSADGTNYKVNNTNSTGALKILENDNTAGTLYSEKRSITLDLTKFNDGSASSTSDYIYLVFYISDVTKINTGAGEGIKLYFDQAANPAYSNNVVAIITSDLVTGWNFKKIVKSDFTVNGTGAWSGIQSITMTWTSLANAQNAYVTFNLIQLVRKDPSSAAPNPFQSYDGTTWSRDAAINDGEWFVGYELGKLIMRNICSTDADSKDLIFTKPYTDFHITAFTEILNTTDPIYLGWYQASNAYFRVEFIAADKLYLREYDGSWHNTATVSSSTTFASGDKIRIDILKYGKAINVKLYKNNSDIPFVEGYCTLTYISSSTAGCLLVGDAGATKKSNIESLYITTTEHAHTSDLSNNTENNAVLYNAGAFTASTLKPGQYGIDTTNHRVYFIYLDGTVKYASLS